MVLFSMIFFERNTSKDWSVIATLAPSFSSSVFKANNLSVSFILSVFKPSNLQCIPKPKHVTAMV